MFRTVTHAESRIATLEVEQGHYLDLTALLSLIPDPNHRKLYTMLHDHRKRIETAKGSSHNHQAWEGGYIEHVVETMNIACQQYAWMSKARTLPFELAEALEVMFLHDIEKPFKTGKLLTECECSYGADCLCAGMEATKENRKKWRAQMIKKYEILLSEDQENALEYVEGVPDSKYTPGERTMNELAAFCHCCDILSARLWWDRGHSVPAPNWQY